MISELGDEAFIFGQGAFRLLAQRPLVDDEGRQGVAGGVGGELAHEGRGLGVGHAGDRLDELAHAGVDDLGRIEQRQQRPARIGRG